MFHQPSWYTRVSFHFASASSKVKVAYLFLGVNLYTFSAGIILNPSLSKQTIHVVVLLTLLHSSPQKRFSVIIFYYPRIMLFISQLFFFIHKINLSSFTFEQILSILSGSTIRLPETYLPDSYLVLVFPVLLLLHQL